MLWELAASERVTYFGTSAAFIMTCRNQGIEPGAKYDLASVHSVGSTGAPLPIEGYEWIYKHVGSDLILASASGGTDVCSGFVGSCPWVPVWAGEISCRYLGVKAEVYDDAGQPSLESPGNSL